MDSGLSVHSCKYPAMEYIQYNIITIMNQLNSNLIIIMFLHQQLKGHSYN